MGIRARPQYQETRVNMSNEAGNATGKAKSAECLFQGGIHCKLQQSKDNEPAEYGNDLLFRGYQASSLPQILN